MGHKNTHPACIPAPEPRTSPSQKVQEYTTLFVLSQVDVLILLEFTDLDVRPHKKGSIQHMPYDEKDAPQE